MTKTIIFAILLTGLVVLGSNYENLAFGQNPKELTVDKSVPWEKSQLFPGWFNQNMKWFLDGQLSEQELATGFEYLINENIIFLNPERAQEVAELRSENAALKKKLDTDGIIAPKTMSPIDDQGRVKVQFHWDEQTEQESLHHLRKAYDLNPNMQTKVIQFDKDHDKWIDVLSIDWGASSTNEDCSAAEGSSDDKSSCWIRVSQVHSSKGTGDMTLKGSKIHENSADTSRQTITFTGLEFASDTVKSLVSDAQTSKKNWEDRFFEDMAIKLYGTTDSTIDELQGIVVLCSTAIEKEIQKIETELDILKELHDKKSDELTERSGSSTQYRESDLEFIKRHAVRIDAKILSLQTGLDALAEKLDAAKSGSFPVEREMKESGEKAGTEDINIGIGELQNSIQKQQQTLQTMSGISKSLQGIKTAALSVS